MTVLKPPSCSRKCIAGKTLWRMQIGMALFWIVALAILYVGMARYLQPKAAQVTAEGVVMLERQRDGHFYADGTINGQPVRFMVDTGASAIAVTEALAQRAGLVGGEVVNFHTANGLRQGRMVRADTVTVGPLQVRNLRVGTGYTGKRMDAALLGQNFLQHFDVLIRGTTMELRPRHQ